MASIFHLYKCLTAHPGSFLDYSAWIALRGYKSSETGPCPINEQPFTEGLWIAKYIFDCVTPYLPETLAEHDISLYSLDSSGLASLSSHNFSKLIYTVNRHLILDSSSDFIGFDSGIASPEGGEQENNCEQIVNFQKRINSNDSDKGLVLFLALCLSAHASYNLATQQLKEDTQLPVQWDDETEERLISIFNSVFPAELADCDYSAQNQSNSSQKQNTRREANDISEGFLEDEEVENEPLLSSDGTANVVDEEDEHPLFQKSFYAREIYLRVPLPKKRYKAELDWVALGFQGANPTTDFRATGHLGLKFFEGFCISDPELARDLMAESGSFNGDLSKAWYPVALASINMTLFIRKITGGRFLYRGILSNLDLSKIYRELVHKYSDNPESMDISELITTLQAQCMDLLSKLHNTLVSNYHQFWRNEVKKGLVKTPLDVDASIIRFQESIQFKLFDGTWINEY